MAFIRVAGTFALMLLCSVAGQQRGTKRGGNNIFGKRSNSVTFGPIFSQTPSTNACDKIKECPTHQPRYRQMNGICNNAVDGTSGAANYTLKRLLKPDYGDGKGTIRLSRDGTPLPSARVLANLLSDDAQKDSKLHTHMMPWWGQFITHDMIDTPKENRDDGAKYNCNCESPDPRGCINIEVSKTDQQFLRAAKKCIQVTRSEASTCQTETRQQVNRLTSYLDAGNVYSDNEDYFHNLINPLSPIGEMKTGEYESRGTNLPTSLQTAQDFRGKTTCDLNFRKPSTMPCFAAGDRRANENTGLTALHTVFVRFHNKITRRLRVINRHWSRDRIIQETKLITSAVQQIITYGEFIPTVIGKTWSKRFGLELAEKGYWFGYRSHSNSAISAAFSTAAFRFGHTSIGSLMHRIMPHWHGAQGRPMDIKESFFNAQPIMNRTGGGIDAIIRGLLVDRSHETSFNMNPAFRNFLFTHKGLLGDDLLAINTQRGRDHGLPSYNDYRVLCGMKRAVTFNDFDDIPPFLRQKLKQGYRHVGDVDLYIGGLMEAVVEGGAVGPTFACIIGHQFRDIRSGDRYWHENPGPMASFTAAQLESLRSYGLAKMLCDTSLDMVSLQKFPMLLSSFEGNERVLCSSLPELNLIPWKDQKTVSKDFDLPRENAVEWSSWFPGEDNGVEMPAMTVLRDVSMQRSSEICSEVISTQTRRINSLPQYRYLCLKGKISSSDFPLIPNPDYEVWGPWLSLGKPDAATGDDVEKNDGTICNKAIDFQVVTVDKWVPARETGDVFETFSPSQGLVCRGKHQRSGKCHDYQVRYLCRKPTDAKKPQTTRATTTTATTPPTTTPKKKLIMWSPWISRDSAMGNGDFELLQDVRLLRGFCQNPVAIEARTVRGHIPAQSTKDNIFVLHKSYGLICQNQDQIRGMCNDYEVRYKCDYS